MAIDALVPLLVSLGLLIYLFFVLLRPERF
jgi:K+-transporting ATPase KdpF subunit